MDTFAERLMYKFEESGMKQVELAEKVGCSPTMVSFWLNGVNKPRRANLEILAEVLGCTEEFLMYGTGGVSI